MQSGGGDVLPVADGICRRAPCPVLGKLVTLSHMTSSTEGDYVASAGLLTDSCLAWFLCHVASFPRVCPISLLLIYFQNIFLIPDIVTHTGLEITAIPLPQSSQCWDYRHLPPCPPLSRLLYPGNISGRGWGREVTVLKNNELLVKMF